MSTTSYCHVSECRFPQFHTTYGHKCGKCHQYGHGLLECNQLTKLSQLKKYNDFLPVNKHCKFGRCKYARYHTSEGHHCSVCGDRLHDKNTCPSNNYNQSMVTIVKCPICKQDNSIKKNQQKVIGLSDTCVVCMNANVNVFFPNCGHVCVCQSCCYHLSNGGKIDPFDDIRNENFLNHQNYDIIKIKNNLREYPSYLHVHEGMGCYSIVRRLGLQFEVEALFVHSDDGYLPEKQNKIDDFISGYCYVDSEQLYHEWTNL